MLMDDPNAERGILDFLLEKGRTLTSALVAAEEGEKAIKRGEALGASFTRVWYQNDLERLPKAVQKLHHMHGKGEAASDLKKTETEKHKEIILRLIEQ